MLSRARARLRSWTGERAGCPGPQDALLQLSDADLQEELRRARDAVQLAQTQRDALETALAPLCSCPARDLEARRSALRAQVTDLERRCAEVRRASASLDALLGEPFPEQATPGPSPTGSGRATRSATPPAGARSTTPAASKRG